MDELKTCRKCTVVWNPRIHPTLVVPTESEEEWCPRCIAKKRLQFLRFQMEIRQTWFKYWLMAAQLAMDPNEKLRHLGVANNHANLLSKMSEVLDDLLVME